MAGPFFETRRWLGLSARRWSVLASMASSPLLSRCAPRSWSRLESRRTRHQHREGHGDGEDHQRLEEQDRRLGESRG
jgi:hypothetical protein